MVMLVVGDAGGMGEKYPLIGRLNLCCLLVHVRMYCVSDTKRIVKSTDLTKFTDLRRLTSLMYITYLTVIIKEKSFTVK